MTDELDEDLLEDRLEEELDDVETDEETALEDDDDLALDDWELEDLDTDEETALEEDAGILELDELERPHMLWHTVIESEHPGPILQAYP